MGKGKGAAVAEKPDAIDGDGHPIEDKSERKDRFGRCPDCDEPVDVVVDIYQLTEPCKWICPDCRANRIREKAQNEAGAVIRKGDKAADAVLEEAEETRKALIQGTLYDAEEPDDDE